MSVPWNIPGVLRRNQVSDVRSAGRVMWEEGQRSCGVQHRRYTGIERYLKINLFTDRIKL